MEYPGHWVVGYTGLCVVEYTGLCVVGYAGHCVVGYLGGYAGVVGAGATDDGQSVSSE